LGGEYVDGNRLAVVATFVLGSVRACIEAVHFGDEDGVTLPTCLNVAIRPDDRRFGWFVSRVAFGPDLYANGRATVLRTVDGRTISAQEHLAQCWATVRSALGFDLSPAEHERIENIMIGPQSLPSFSAESREMLDHSGPSRNEIAAAYGRSVGEVSRTGFEMAPVMLTWDRVVFLAATPDRSRRCFVNVPGGQIVTFHDQLNAGALDAVIISYLELPRGRRRVPRCSAGIEAGLFDILGPRAKLLTPERAAIGRRKAKREAHRQPRDRMMQRPMSRRNRRSLGTQDG